MGFLVMAPHQADQDNVQYDRIELSVEARQAGEALITTALTYGEEMETDLFNIKKFTYSEDDKKTGEVHYCTIQVEYDKGVNRPKRTDINKMSMEWTTRNDKTSTRTGFLKAEVVPDNFTVVRCTDNNFLDTRYTFYYHADLDDVDETQSIINIGIALQRVLDTIYVRQ